MMKNEGKIEMSEFAFFHVREDTPCNMQKRKRPSYKCASRHLVETSWRMRSDPPSNGTDLEAGGVDAASILRSQKNATKIFIPTTQTYPVVPLVPRA